MDNQFDENEKNLFFSEMLDLSSLYKTVKHLVLLSEYYNNDQKIVLSTINELRNTLDHIMRALYSNVKINKEELYKAKGHLYRAAFDACEVIAIDRLDYINNFKNSVSFSTLYKVYPQYYKEVLPFISQVKEELARSREIPVTYDRVEKYQEIISKLIIISDSLDRATPNIYKQNKRSNKNLYFVMSIFSTMLGLMIISYTCFSYFANFTLLTNVLISVFISLLYPFLTYFIKTKRHGRNN